MIINLKKKDLAFAMTPVREDNSLSDFTLVQNIKVVLTDYQPEDVVSVAISKERLFSIYQKISNLQEGYATPYSESITKGDAQYAGLNQQIAEKCALGDEEFIWLAQKVQAWRANYVKMAQEAIEANLSFIQSI